MASFNKVLLIGNLTRDPQLKYLPSQTAVVEFGLAINHKYKTKQGEDREDVCFVDCTAFGKGGEIINQYCQKGKQLMVEGRLKYDTWEDKQGGGKRSKLSVVVDTRLQRGERGVITQQTASMVKPLLAEFTDRLKHQGRDSMYVYTTGKRLARLVTECGWLQLGHITPESVNAWIAGKPTWRKKRLSNRTLNQFIDTAREFGAWLHKPKRLLNQNPLEDLDRLSATPNTFYRRSATMDEVQRLIAHASKDRQRFYLFLLYSPLRMKAIKGLVWDDLRLDLERPVVQVRAEIDKNRKGQQLPLRLDVAQLLRLARGKAKGSAKVFPVLPTMDDLRDDLKAAGVPFSDEKGNRRLDRHAFRRTLISFMKSAGVSLDVAHQALGHRDKRTTEKWYDDSLANAPISNAMESLPSVSTMRIAGGEK